MSTRERERGYLKMRKGIFEHLKKGWMDEQMFTGYMIMLDKADWATGVWIGSAASLRAEVGGQWSERTAERVIERLAEGRYIVSLFQRGKRGNYPILMNNYEATAGENKGKKLRPVAAGKPLSADISDDNPDGGIMESDVKTAVMAVGASAKVTTKVPTELPTKVPTQVASIQDTIQETLTSFASQDALTRQTNRLTNSEAPSDDVFGVERPE